MTESVADRFEIPNPITVVGDRTVRLDDTVRTLPVRTRSAEVVCASGDRYSAEWTGIGGDTLCEIGTAPPETTHLLVESRDGYRMAVSIADGLAGVLAFQKNGRSIGGNAPYSNRFVAPGVEGARDVKGVSRIEFHALDPGTDPERLEQVEPDDDRFEAER